MRKRVWRLFVWCLFVFKLTNLQTNKLSHAEINNTLAYSISNTSSTEGWDLGPVTSKTVAQTILATVDETWYGIVVYLDRKGLSSNTDSVKLRFRKLTEAVSCSTPDTNGAPKRDVYVKVLDIPDGDAAGNTLPPDSIARGYAIWFIFNTPVDVLSDDCWQIFLNAPYTDANNCINQINGSNGYANGSSWEQTTGGWIDQGTDMDFRVIKDKYALVAIRRFPFNLKGALSISSDIDHSSFTYMDSLHCWLNSSDNCGGRWGTGLNGNIAGNDLWFGRASTAESTGTYTNDPIPFYFHGLDTTSNYYKDTIDNYISRRWMDANHGYVDCSGTSNCADSTNVLKWLNYMLNRPSAFGKMYKAGVWVNHGTAGQNTINFGLAGETTRLGDSSGTVYHHAHRTLASGRVKFVWIGDLIDPGTSSSQYLPYINWQSKTGIDSLNLNSGIFDSKTLRDNIKTYIWRRIGRSAAALPESTYKFFNRSVALRCADSNWVSVVYTHLGKNSGLNAANIDSIRQVYNNAASYGLWIPSTKQIFNQQAASMFAQVTVDRPTGSKRRVNIRSLYDWSWGSHVPDREELYFLNFIAYAPESLIVTINGIDTLNSINMTGQQDVPTDYNDVASGVANRRAMSWVGMYNRTAGRKVIVEGAEAYDTGEKYPTLGESVSESPWSDDAWVTPTNIYSDNAATANVVASTFDSPDQTYVLKATGFDFSSIPDGSTINGVICRANSWYRSGQGSGSMDLMQLLDVSKARVGTNQCLTAVPLTTTDATIITKGSYNDTWGNALTAAWVKNSNFGVGIGILATAANADVDVDYVTLEIFYTPPTAAAGKRNRTALIEQLLTVQDKKFCPEVFK